MMRSPLFPFGSETSSFATFVPPFDEVEAPPDTTPPTLVSATVNANGSITTLVFSEAVTSNDWGNLESVWLVTSTGEQPTLTYNSGDTTTTIICGLNKTILAVDVLTLDGSSVVFDMNGNGIQGFTDFPITNNSVQ